jgi:hypothetical protein
MKFLLLTLALSLASIQLHADDSAQNAYSTKVRLAINKKLGLSNTEEFEIVRQGHTTFGKNCEVKIEQNIESSNGLYYVFIDTEGRDTYSGFQFHEGIKSENMAIVKSDATQLSLKLSERECSGGFPLHFCDNTVKTLDLTILKGGKIKVETYSTIKALKGLWSSERSACIIDAE